MSLLKRTKRNLWLIAVVGLYLGIVYFGRSNAGTLSCSVMATSSCSGTIILKMSSTTNAHAELATSANYSQAVCCTGVAGLGTSCSAPFATIGGLTSSTNSHVSQTVLAPYSAPVCISAPAGGSVSVGYTTTLCSTAGYDTTLFSMYATTNSHIGSSTAYTNHVCATASVPSNSPPSVSGVSLNSGNAMNLIPNSTVSISATANVSDSNGVTDIKSATSTFFRSGLGAGCVANDQNCYQIASSSCSFNVGTTTVTCSTNLKYFAQPTDASSSFSSDTWQAKIAVTDGASAVGSSTSSGVELNTLLAIDVSPSSINYGSLSPGLNTGATNQVEVVSNVGNSSSTLNLSGTDMTGSGGTIVVGSQHYAGNAFTFGTGDISLSTTPTSLAGFSLAAPTSPTAVTKNAYFGIGLGVIKVGSYSGTNTFTAVWTP